MAKLELTGAINYLDKALAFNMNDIEALYAKSLALFNLERYKEGVNYINEAITLDSKNKAYPVLK